MSGGLDYFTHRDSAGQHDLYEGEEESHHAGYLTDLISERAVDFIVRPRERQAPFLLSVHYTAPHWPWETRDDKAVARTIEKMLDVPFRFVSPRSSPPTSGRRRSAGI